VIREILVQQELKVTLEIQVLKVPTDSLHIRLHKLKALQELKQNG
jgi:hypothetical protein